MMATTAEIDAFLAAITGFESGGNATAQNPNASASGLYGYIDSTWANYGGYRHAKDAPAEVQRAKARADVAAKLKAYGGDWRKVAMSWYLPAAVNNPALQNVVPARSAGNTKTPAEYADMVMGRFTGTTGGVMTAQSAKPKPQGDLLDYIASNYPDVYGLLSVNAEVKKVLLAAAAGEWTQAKMRSALAKTAWWKTTAATARQWDADYALDKATGDDRIRKTAEAIKATAQQIGLSVGWTDLTQMALKVNREGWSQQQITQALAARFNVKSTGPGAGLATVDSLRAVAADYGVSVSDSTLNGWTQQVLGGTKDMAAFRSYVVRQAQSLFPSIASDISEGQTVREYFDPYVQSASRILGVNPNDVDLSDTKWRRALVQNDATTGKRVPMSLDQWDTELRTNPLYGYDTTTTGRASADAFRASLLQAVGQ